VRDASGTGMGSQLGAYTLRIAVKDGATNEQILAILGNVLMGVSAARID